VYYLYVSKQIWAPIVTSLVKLSCCRCQAIAPLILAVAIVLYRTTTSSTRTIATIHTSFIASNSNHYYKGPHTGTWAYQYFVISNLTHSSFVIAILHLQDSSSASLFSSTLFDTQCTQVRSCTSIMEECFSVGTAGLS
jgi:hypothetical protein